MSRRAHYSGFYDGPVEDGRPLGLVHGNCQAEALRVLLGGSASSPWQLVRVPPVHELRAHDLPALDQLLARAALVVSQPVREDYRGLPLGTAQVASRLPPRAVVLRVPIVRWTGLHPWQAIVRVPDGAEPPLVPYHDLRLLTGREPVSADLPAAARANLDALAARERRDTDVGVHDLLPALGAGAMHTLNHPANATLLALARRVQVALGAAPDAADPGRELLGRVRAPLEVHVLAAQGLPLSAARERWLVDGEPVPAEAVRAAHLAWYASRPDAVRSGLVRHAGALPALGLA